MLGSKPSSIQAKVCNGSGESIRPDTHHIITKFGKCEKPILPIDVFF